MESIERARTLVQTSIDALEFLRGCEHVSGTFFQLEKHTTELFSDSTYTERHSVISACIGSYEGLEVTFLRIQQEERDHAAAVGRILETIKSSPSTGPRRLTRKERLDSARNTLLYRMLETIQLFYVSVKLVLDRSAETEPLEALLGDIRTYLAEFVQFLKANLDKSTLPRKPAETDLGGYGVDETRRPDILTMAANCRQSSYMSDRRK